VIISRCAARADVGGPVGLEEIRVFLVVAHPAHVVRHNREELPGGGAEDRMAQTVASGGHP
jgi:hypothetical protein